MKPTIFAVFFLLMGNVFSQVITTNPTTQHTTGNLSEYPTSYSKEKVYQVKTKGDHTSHFIKNTITGVMDTGTCNIRGNISSLSTGFMDGTKLELRNGDITYITEADKAGRFELLHILPGLYSLKVYRTGHKKLFIRNLVIKNGNMYQWDIYLAYKNMDREYIFFKLK